MNATAKYFGNAWIFGLVFSITLLLDVAIREIVLPHLLPQLHLGQGFVIGGDSQGFHYRAVWVAEQIRAQGWSLWRLEPFVSQDGPVRIAAVLYAIFGSNPLVLLPMNAAAHALSAVLLVNIFAGISRDRVDAVVAAMPFVLFPTAAYWHSQLHRDGLYILGVYAWLAGTLLLFRPQAMTARRWASVLALIACGVTLIWLFRGYVLVVLVALLGGITLLLAACAVRWLRQRQVLPSDLAARVACLLVVCGALAVIGGAGKTDIPDWAFTRYVETTPSLPVTVVAPTGAGQPTAQQLRVLREGCQYWRETEYVPRVLDDLALSLVVAREGLYGSSYLNATSTLDWHRCITSFGELVAYLPRALQIGLLAPFPTQWTQPSPQGGRALRLLAGAEMSVAYLTMLAALPAAWRFRRRPELWVVLLVAVSMLVLYAIVTPNVGTQHRMRYGFLMLVVGLGAGEISARLRQRGGD